MNPLLAVVLIAGAVVFAFATRGTSAGKYAPIDGEHMGYRYRVYFDEGSNEWRGLFADPILGESDIVYADTRDECEAMVKQAIEEYAG